MRTNAGLSRHHETAHEEVIETAEAIALRNRIRRPHVAGFARYPADILAVHVAAYDDHWIPGCVVEYSAELLDPALPSKIHGRAEMRGIHANVLAPEPDGSCSRDALRLRVPRPARENDFRVLRNWPARKNGVPNVAPLDAIVDRGIV